MPAMFLLLPALAILAQPSASAQASEAQVPVFRSDTSLALIRFHVVRKRGYVDDLKAEDVILLEDGAPRKLAVFEGGRLTPRTIPIEMILLFDTSGSVTNAGLLDPLAYKTTLLDNLPNVRLSVYSFTSELRRHCRATRDPAELAAALQGVTHARSGAGDAQKISLQLPPGRKGGPETWLFEAITGAVKDSAAEPGQVTRMLVVFSDGFPTTNSRPEDAATALAETGVPVYPVVLGHAGIAAMKASGQIGWPRMAELFMADFARMADLTGGRSFDPPAIDVSVVRQILATMAAQAVSEYVVGFQAEPSAGGARKRKLEVRLRSKDIGAVLGGARTLVH
jgi:VWFA-related protein